MKIFYVISGASVLIQQGEPYFTTFTIMLINVLKQLLVISLKKLNKILFEFYQDKMKGICFFQKNEEIARNQISGKTWLLGDFFFILLYK